MRTLVAVQAKLELSDCVSAERFREKVFALCARCRLPEDGADPVLAVFPELMALPLLFALDEDPRALAACQRFSDAGVRLLKRDWRNVIAVAWQHKTFGLNAFYLSRAQRAYGVYKQVFSEAAKRYNLTIVAGSGFFPLMDAEVSRGLFCASKQVFNSSTLFAPTGATVTQTHKVYLTPGREQQAGLSSGRLQDLTVAHTPAGRVGVAICLDGFHDSVTGHLDALGADIVAQPSANNAAWDGPWHKNTGQLEGDVWLQQGLRAQLQARTCLRYGVNPMLITDLWDLQTRGRSSIVANACLVKADWQEQTGILAIAESHTKEEIVRARVS